MAELTFMERLDIANAKYDEISAIIRSIPRGNNENEFINNKYDALHKIINLMFEKV